jgi:transcriptional regulator with XRE-family HTH domain
MNRIKELLNEKGITQTWLAEKLGKSFKIVNAYACNRQQPPIETLYRISEILQVSVKDLLIEDKGNYGLMDYGYVDKRQRIQTVVRRIETTHSPKSD